MADNWTRSIICRYYKNGMCREGENCRYRHTQIQRQDANTTESEVNAPISTCNVPCLYFKHGICRFADNCHFRHSSDNANESPVLINQAENSSENHGTDDSILNSLKIIRNKSAVEVQEWVNAPEFVPSPATAGSSLQLKDELNSCSALANASMPLSYAQAVNPSRQLSYLGLEPLCPYAETTGICKRFNCTYLHGKICELCSKPALHPYDEEQQRKHTNECVKQHEDNMELSFAIQRSRDKSCGVCFETIMEKSSREQRFGILPNCNHCFCLTCIRKWRQAKQFDNKIIRACPECRVASDFVCPSMYWVDTKEEKEKLINDYKNALSLKDCKYFNKGSGKCPFGNKCFYLHALPDGTKRDVGPPVRHRRNADNDMDILHQLILWDFIEDREDRWMYLDFEDISQFLSDSEESEWSDLELSFD